MKKIMVMLGMLISLLTVPAMAANTQVPILMYHRISENPGSNNLIVTPQRFRQDMETLRDYGYTPLWAKDLVAIRNGSEAMPDKPVMITFDDGYQDNYDYAYPILKETGMKATIAVISGNIRGVDSCGTPYGPSGFLSWAECKEMYESGYMDIGSHTNNLHNPGTRGIVVPGGPNGVQRHAGETKEAYDQRVSADLSHSKNAIEKYVGNQVVYLAYPFGASDSWCTELLPGLGYQVTTTTTTAMANISNGLYNLPRYRISMKENESVANRLIQPETASTSQSKISVDGKLSEVSTYLIHSNNYIKLRDIASLLNGTASQVQISWDQKSGTVSVATGQAYTPTGGELSRLASNKLTVKETLSKVTINGQTQKVPAYLMHNHYYYKMRDLAKYFGFQIDWDANSKTVVLRTQ